MASTSTDPRQDQRTVPELFRELANETAQLVRKEVELARTELALKTEEAKMTAFAALAGMALFFSGVIILLLGLVYGIGESLPIWIAALIVGSIAAIAGAMMLRSVEHAPAKLLKESTRQIKMGVTEAKAPTTERLS